MVEVKMIPTLAVAVFFAMFAWLWYAKWAFGRIWAEHAGLPELELNVVDMIWGLVAFIMKASILAVCISYVRPASIIDGAFVGALLAFGFAVTCNVTDMIWQKRPFKLFLVHSGHNIVGMAIAGAIFAVWG